MACINFYNSRLNMHIASMIQDDLEDVRQLRNQPYIANNMRYRKPITADQQIDWWYSLDKVKTVYLTLKINSELIGVVNLKDINIEAETAEWGLFLKDTYHGGLYSTIASLTILNYAFNNLNLTNILATVLPHNLLAKSLNTGLGFKIIKEIDQELTYSLQKDDYLKKNKILQKLL